MKLYGTLASPFVRHCRIVLAQLEMDYTIEECSPMEIADRSHTQRVPFFEDGDVSLTDSKSIIHYLRQKADQPFLPGYEDTELFAVATTGLDACVNLFIMSMFDATPENIPYLQRHVMRAESILSRLETLSLDTNKPYDDVIIRIGCFIAYGEFREQFSLEDKPNLRALLDRLNAWPPFAETTPE